MGGRVAQRSPCSRWPWRNSPITTRRHRSTEHGVRSPRMEFKDYYAALGVSPNARDQEIKQAYRTLARRHHPDVNPGDKAAEDRFKEVNEAYQALSDPERRRKYDEMRQQYEAYQRSGGPRG